MIKYSIDLVTFIENFEGAIEGCWMLETNSASGGSEVVENLTVAWNDQCLQWDRSSHFWKLRRTNFLSGKSFEPLR
ncbi:unnamed protein product [Ambrosiozyma monospora]|uniref:Unnamed protein product n=1 Tax=Ambrosiozyma monospora TaxID=43982 RepID=A0A9W7DHU2_AMBMO|nr:unnamed protein product [Ambrosiozyma monospora]